MAVGAFVLSEYLSLSSCGVGPAPPPVECSAVNGMCSLQPVRVAGSISFSMLAAGYQRTCALDPEGAAWCWGLGFTSGSGIARHVPTRIATDLRFTTLRSSRSSGPTCGRTSAGTWWCWGGFPLGDGSFLSSSTPREVAGQQAFADVGVGSRHACGLLADGVAWCWGMNFHGAVGDGTTGDALVPVQVNTSERFVQIVAGLDFTCARTADGVIWCWGTNSSHQIADDQTVLARQPVRLVTSSRFTSLAAGAMHVCALASDRSIHCWGENGQGQLGRPSYQSQGTPTPVAVAGASAFRQVLTGAFQSCGLTDDGALYCWGSSNAGQLGQKANRPNPETPIAVQASFRFSWITASETHMCGLTTQGLAYCWGDASLGALGGG